MLYDSEGIFCLPLLSPKIWYPVKTAEKAGASLLFLQEQKAEAVGGRVFLIFSNFVSVLPVYLGHRVSGESASL